MSGKLLYQGKSLLDHKTEIIVVGLSSSNNKKTGNMVQTYILVKDTDPRLANKTGLDVGICGNCPHKGTPHNDPKFSTAKNRPCYVMLGWGPKIVWDSYNEGLYPAATAKEIIDLGDNKPVRLGTYGDPAAVPRYVWDLLLKKSSGHTGYSHQQKITDPYSDICMRSVESEKEAREAWSDDIRTFRVIENINQIIKGKEILCPASEEAGKKTTCSLCQLCSGSTIKKRNIAIVVHGPGKTHMSGRV